MRQIITCLLFMAATLQFSETLSAQDIVLSFPRKDAITIIPRELLLNEEDFFATYFNNNGDPVINTIYNHSFEEVETIEPSLFYVKVQKRIVSYRRKIEYQGSSTVEVPIGEWEVYQEETREFQLAKSLNSFNFYSEESRCVAQNKMLSQTLFDQDEDFEFALHPVVIIPVEIETDEWMKQHVENYESSNNWDGPFLLEEMEDSKTGKTYYYQIKDVEYGGYYLPRGLEIVNQHGVVKYSLPDWISINSVYQMGEDTYISVTQRDNVSVFRMGDGLSDLRLIESTPNKTFQILHKAGALVCEGDFDGECQIVVSTVSGLVLKTAVFTHSPVILPIQDLGKGTYLVSAFMNGNLIASSKFIQ